VRPSPGRRRALLAATALVVAGCAADGGRESATVARPAPIRPPPTDESLAPGLAVTYWYRLVRTIRELEGWMQAGGGAAGAPIAGLDHVMGNGPVLTSGASTGVGADIVGFIRLAAPGRYVFVANSNDGIRVAIGGITVVEDPDVHADRLSSPVIVEIVEPGWYALRILYFQRRNTATLQLFWTPPGRSDRAIVPADVLRRPRTPA
jgi:hypothetical protein